MSASGPSCPLVIFFTFLDGLKIIFMTQIHLRDIDGFGTDLFYTKRGAICSSHSRNYPHCCCSAFAALLIFFHQA